MRIIIVGCGKVGETITSRLIGEGHDIAVIDTDSKVITSITNNLDVLGLVGNGASYDTLEEAGIGETDLLIAVTDSDEMNLLCCLFAKKAGNCSTIARIRNPVYFHQLPYIRDELGLSMTINPESAAAMEMARILRFPSAIKIDTFAKGKVELLQFVIPENSVLDKCTLMELPKKVKAEVLVCAVERFGDVVIPNGSFMLRAQDTISIVASHNNAKDFFRKIGVDIHSVSNTLIVGGGTLSYYLANQLILHGIDVKIIENDMARCEQMSDLLPKATVIYGDGTERDLLMEEGVETCESFVSLTGIDEENIFLSLFAHQVNPTAKIITKTDRIAMDDIISGLNPGVMVHPKDITAEYILRYVRAMQNSMGSNMESLYSIVEGKAEALEFSIHEDAPVIDIPLSVLPVRDNVLIACIFRKGQIILPNGSTSIQVGDNVIIVTTHKGFSDIKDILRA